MSKTEYGAQQMDSYEGQPGYGEKIEVLEAEKHHNDLSTGNGETGGLQRNLQARHLTMISLGGTIGTGLFLASGSSIATAGPGYALIAYGLIGTMVYCFMSSLGEMTTYLPITGSINAYGTRFVDPAFGFMLGKIPSCLYGCPPFYPLNPRILLCRVLVSLLGYTPFPWFFPCSFQSST
jgi:amino acid permease